MDSACCAVVVAAGSSSRMGAPKQLMELLGVPAIVWTLRAFDRAETVSSLVLVVREEDRETIGELASRFGIRKPFVFASGGSERQLSVLSGLRAVPRGTRLAAVHDGARCLVTPGEIDAAVRAAGEECGSALAVRVKDTIKTASPDGLVLSTPPRDSLWAVETPQVFPYERFLLETERAAAEGRLYTDDCQVWEHAGLPVRLCEGSYENLKLTTREDVLSAKAILRRRGEQG